MSHPLFVNIRDVVVGDVIAITSLQVFLVEDIGPEIKTPYATRKGEVVSWFLYRELSGVRIHGKLEMDFPERDWVAGPKAIATSEVQSLTEFKITIDPSLQLMLLRRNQTRETVMSS